MPAVRFWSLDWKLCLFGAVFIITQLVSAIKEPQASVPLALSATRSLPTAVAWRSYLGRAPFAAARRAVRNKELVVPFGLSGAGVSHGSSLSRQQRDSATFMHTEKVKSKNRTPEFIRCMRCRLDGSCLQG